MINTRLLMSQKYFGIRNNRYNRYSQPSWTVYLLVRISSIYADSTRFDAVRRNANINIQGVSTICNKSRRDAREIKFNGITIPRFRSIVRTLRRSSAVQPRTDGILPSRRRKYVYPVGNHRVRPTFDSLSASRELSRSYVTKAKPRGSAVLSSSA